MSHTTKIKSVVIRDIAALRATVEQLKSKGVKCSLVENAVPRMYYSGQHAKCDFVLRLEDSRYDVGFDKQADGTYEPVYDNWQNEIGKLLGATGKVKQDESDIKPIGSLLQAYGVNATINAAQSQGYQVLGTTEDADGNIHLQLAV